MQSLLRWLIDRVKCTGMSEIIGPFFRAKMGTQAPRKRGARIVRHSAHRLLAIIQDDPVCRRLMTIVDPMLALTYRAIVDAVKS